MAFISFGKIIYDNAMYYVPVLMKRNGNSKPALRPPIIGPGSPITRIGALRFERDGVHGYEGNDPAKDDSHFHLSYLRYAAN